MHTHALPRAHALIPSQLGGVPALVKLLASDDREVLRNSCLALTCCAKHPEALPQMYTLKSMKMLIELLGNGNEDVQEQASCVHATPKCFTELQSYSLQIHHRLRRVWRGQHEGLQATRGR